jgi:hypothetical protein
MKYVRLLYFFKNGFNKFLLIVEQKHSELCALLLPAE